MLSGPEDVYMYSYIIEFYYFFTFSVSYMRIPRSRTV